MLSSVRDDSFQKSALRHYLFFLPRELRVTVVLVCVWFCSEVKMKIIMVLTQLVLILYHLTIGVWRIYFCIVVYFIVSLGSLFYIG